MKKDMLELKNVSFQVAEDRGDKEIIRGVSLAVPESKLVVITGPNGGSKSRWGSRDSRSTWTAESCESTRRRRNGTERITATGSCRSCRHSTQSSNANWRSCRSQSPSSSTKIAEKDSIRAFDGFSLTRV